MHQPNMSPPCVLFYDAHAQCTAHILHVQFDNHTVDHKQLPTSEWRLAIDPSTIVVSDKSTGTIPFFAWAPGSQPVTMTASACQIDWGLTLGTASAPPASPNVCQGPVTKVKLVPFAAANLRLGEIPVMSVK